MIVDELRAANPAFRSLTQGAQVIRVPYEVCPATDEPDGQWGIWWREQSVTLAALVPRGDPPIRREDCVRFPGVEEKDSSGIVCDWWRPPYDSMVIASEKGERGAMFVLSSGALRSQVPRIGTSMEDSVAADWAAMIGLVWLHPTIGMVAPLTFQVIAVGGFLLTNIDTFCQNTVVTQFMLAGRRDREGFRAALAAVAAALQDGHYALDKTNATCTFAMTMALMNCKNIATELHGPTRQQRRHQERCGALPLVSWHLLKLRQSARSASKGGTGEPLALHWVRGHFKRYDEHPLFGSRKGAYWWSPHLAGRADRVVLKDYEVTAG